MTHGDDQGLILPPKLAPFQIVIIPIYKTDEEKSLVMPVVSKVVGELQSFRLKIDNREEVTPGFKFNDWEMRGVPLRIEIGPKDVQKGTLAFARRDIPGKAGKTFVQHTQLEAQVAEALQSIQASIFERALAFRRAHTFDPKDYEELKSALEKGWAFAWWCGDAECEAKVKDETKATTRCIPLEQEPGKGVCIVCGKSATEKVIFGRAY
jgi:prolyl-tRNA synthetase